MRIIVFLFLLLLANTSIGQDLKQAEKLIQTGNFTEAKSIYEKTLVTYKVTCSDSALYVAKGLLTTMIFIGELNEAIGRAKIFLDCDNKNTSGIYTALGVIYNIKRDSDSSIYYYKKALINSSTKQKAGIQNNIGILYSESNIDSSLYYYQKALTYYQSQKNRAKISRTHRNIGKTYLIKKNVNKALFHYNESLLFNRTPQGYLSNPLALESTISKAEILPDLQTTLEADSLTKVIQTRITRRSDKLRLSSDLNRVINAALPLLEAKYTQTHQKKHLNFLFYFSERSKSNILLDEIASRNQGKSVAKLITLDTLQKHLKSNQAVITYFRSKKQLYGLGVSKGLVVFQKLGNFTALLDSMEYFQGHSQSIDVRQFLTSAPILYKLLINPFAEALESKTHLLLVPTAEMMGTPFEAFMKGNPLPQGVQNASPKERGQALKNARYLMKDFFVSYHLSATLAFKERERKNYPLDFTALAHSKFASKEVTPLKYSAREAQAAGSYFDSNKKRVLIDSAAHTSVLKGLRSKILHISTHGHYKFGGKLLSGLLLRTTGGAQDTLFADEVYNLGLRVELAVLSGCYSGQGRIESVEGVLGFNRALVYNNVPYIIFSSWQAYDKPTFDFFKLFYKFLSTGKYSYIEALTLTKRAIVSSPTYPTIWAGFMIIGE